MKKVQTSIKLHQELRERAVKKWNKNPIQKDGLTPLIEHLLRAYLSIK